MTAPVDWLIVALATLLLMAVMAVVLLGREVRLCRRHEAMLRGTEEFNLRIMRVLPAHICVVDSGGGIIAVNEAWLRFADDNAATELIWVGVNYLEVCRHAANDSDAQRACDGIERVLAGTISKFVMEYPCHAPKEQRWFMMTAVPMDADDDQGALIAHIFVGPQEGFLRQPGVCDNLGTIG